MAARNNRRTSGAGVKPRPAAQKPAPKPAEPEIVSDDEIEIEDTDAETPEEEIVEEIEIDDEDDADEDSETPATPDRAEVGDLDDTPFRRFWQDFLDRSGVAAPEGRILFPGEPLTFSGNIVRGDIVVLKEDVYRMFVAHRSSRPSFTLEARAGTEVPKVRVVTKTEYRKAVGGLYDTVVVES